MSWDAHLAKLPQNKGAVQGFIVGLDGTKWAPAAAQANEPKKEELYYVCNGFANPNSLRERGPTLAGKKYMITKADDDLIIGKNGTSGFIATKSGKAVQFGFFDESTTTPANANIAVQAFRDYFKSIGF